MFVINILILRGQHFVRYLSSNYCELTTKLVKFKYFWHRINFDFYVLKHINSNKITNFPQQDEYVQK